MSEELKSKYRMTFNYDPNREQGNAGDELSRLAQEEQHKNPKLSFQRALEIAMERNPDLAREYVGGPND